MSTITDISKELGSEVEKIKMLAGRIDELEDNTVIDKIERGA